MQKVLCPNPQVKRSQDPGELPPIRGDPTGPDGLHSKAASVIHCPHDLPLILPPLPYRFCYWVALLLCSSYRGFGFGLAFFPSLFMAAYNLYCLYDLGFGFLFMPAPSGFTHPTAAPILPKETVFNWYRGN